MEPTFCCLYYIRLHCACQDSKNIPKSKIFQIFQHIFMMSRYDKRMSRYDIYKERQLR